MTGRRGIPQRSAIDVAAHYGRVVVALRGVLDARAGEVLLAAVRSAVEAQHGRPAIEVDLRGIDSWTAEGIHEVAECARFGRGVYVLLGDAPLPVPVA